MVTGNDELNSLAYASSAPEFDLAPKVEVKVQDEADLSTLERVLLMLKNRKAYYSSVNSISLGIDLTVENQMIINKQVQIHLTELESLVTATINDVKEHLNGQQ